MPNPTAAYTHTLEVAGQVFNESPDFFSITPALIVGAGAAYSAASILDVSDASDLTSKAVALNHGSNATGRTFHLFQYNITADLALGTLIGMDGFLRFGHLAGGNPHLHRMKLYLWDAVALSWTEIAASNSVNNPRNMDPGPEGGDLTRFVDGSDDIHLLFWDWEGTWQTGGGCVLAGEIIQLASGSVLLDNLQPGQTVADWRDDAPAESVITWINRHYSLRLLITRLATAGGTLALTADHRVLTVEGWKQAHTLIVGEFVLVAGGDVEAITEAATASETVDAFDVFGAGAEALFCGTARIAVAVEEWY